MLNLFLKEIKIIKKFNIFLKLMATYKLQTKTDIKFICILDREVRL